MIWLSELHAAMPSSVKTDIVKEIECNMGMSIVRDKLDVSQREPSRSTAIYHKFASQASINRLQISTEEHVW